MTAAVTSGLSKVTLNVTPKQIVVMFQNSSTNGREEMVTLSGFLLMGAFHHGRHLYVENNENSLFFAGISLWRAEIHISVATGKSQKASKRETKSHLDKNQPQMYDAPFFNNQKVWGLEALKEDPR